MPIERGDIYLVKFPSRTPRGSEIEKRRPCIAMSSTGVNEVRRTVMVVPLTSSPAPAPPIAISVPSAGDRSVAVCDQLNAADKRRLRGRVGPLSAPDLAEVERSLRIVLGL